MTIDRALSDWAEMEDGGSAKQVMPMGYSSSVSDRDPYNPFAVGHDLVTVALDKLDRRRALAAWLLHVHHGGNFKGFASRISNQQNELRRMVSDLLRSAEWQERIKVHERIMAEIENDKRPKISSGAQ